MNFSRERPWDSWVGGYFAGWSGLSALYIGTPVLLGTGLFKKLRLGSRRSSNTSFRLPPGWSRIDKLKERFFRLG